MFLTCSCWDKKTPCLSDQMRVCFCFFLFPSYFTIFQGTELRLLQCFTDDKRRETKQFYNLFNTYSVQMSFHFCSPSTSFCVSVLSLEYHLPFKCLPPPSFILFSSPQGFDLHSFFFLKKKKGNLGTSTVTSE